MKDAAGAQRAAGADLPAGAGFVGDGRRHTLTLSGCMVASVTLTRCALNVSNLVSAPALAPKAASVGAASYLRR